MRRAAKQIACCVALLLLFCLLCRLTLFRTYTVHIPIHSPMKQEIEKYGEPPEFRVEDPEKLQIRQMELQDGFLSFEVLPEKTGSTNLLFYNRAGEEIAYHAFHVSPLGTVFDLQTGGFTGDTAVLIAVTLFWFFVSAIMLWHFFNAKGTAFYAYSTIYYAGFSLFSLVTGLLMALITVSHLLSPAEYNMFSAYGTINGASSRFMMLTMPVMVAFALAMAISNLVLLRHEKKSFQNVLGIAVSLLLLVGEAIGIYLFRRDFMGSEREMRMQLTLENVYATVFVYFECMLMGSVICGVLASRHWPAPDKDFIVILGCWFRKDGGLPPLLRGRVDKAIEFWTRQKELSGKEAILIPSGGQGPDEPMPEAEAMRQYLISREIPARVIRPETESRNTYENMAFSKEIADGIHPKGKAIFSTTSYHVFRSGIYAAQAGLNAEGIGEKTKWWFWPNAFMRECLGLLRKRWKQELLLLVLLVVFFGLLSMVLG